MAIAPIGDQATKHPLWALDCQHLEPAIEVATRRALEALADDLAPSDLAILAALRAYWPPGPHPGPLSRRELHLSAEAKQVIPVVAALMAWNQVRPPPSLTCLTAILLNLALGPEGRDRALRTRIKDVARIVRHAIEDSNADLRGLVAGAASIPTLLAQLDREIANGSRIHQTFNRLWSGLLNHRVARWMLADPRQLRQAIPAPSDLAIDIGSPEVPLWGDPTCGDDDIEWTATEISGAAFDGLRTRATHSLATAHHLLRQSGEVALPLHADQLLPEAIITQVARQSLRLGRETVARLGSSAGGSYLALSFQIATGFREKDLGNVTWGASDHSGDAILWTDAPVLQIRIKRPAGAVTPPSSLVKNLKPSSDTLCWPIPPSLHDALKKLAGTPQPHPGSPVLPQAKYGSDRLRNVVAELLPGAHFGAARFRLVLAAALTEEFGPEVAQLAMRDTFSASLGPAYYGAVPESSVAQAVAARLERWFGEDVPIPAGRNGSIGSRLVLRDEFAREWPRLLRKTAYSAARRKGGWKASLVAERNLLAASLCAATGIRPGRSISDLSLDSVIPEYGLVVLEDKLVDVLRKTRIAATGWRWTAALRDYIDRLIPLAKHHDTAIAQWAQGVLESTLPLFSLPADGDGATPLSMVEFAETMPVPLDEVPNHYRHRLSQRLLEKGVDWQLRHGQLGWVITPSFALADHSPLSPKEFGLRMGGLIDEILVEDGWYPTLQRTPAWSWRGVPDRLLKDWQEERANFEREHAVHVRGVREEFIEKRKVVEDLVLPRLASAFAEYLPALTIDTDKRLLLANPAYPSTGPIVLQEEHYFLLRDRVSNGDQQRASALEALAAEHLIHELVAKAIKEKIVLGPLPPRRHLSVTTQLSPFLPGIGLAVRHAEAMRGKLGLLSRQNRARDRPGIAQLSVLAGTPYRDLELAAAAVGSASSAERSQCSRERLLVPARLNHSEIPLVLAGVEAGILARRAREAPKGRPLTPQKLEVWVKQRLGDVAKAGEGMSHLKLVEGTLQMAGRLELSGPERLIMEGQRVACVSTKRSIAIEDQWPLRTAINDAVMDEAPFGHVKESAARERDPATSVERSSYSKLTRILNSQVSRRSAGKRSDGKYAWRGGLEKSLLALREETKTENLRVLIEYALHRLRHGGKRRARLSQGTLHKEITRFGRALLDVLGPKSLLLEKSGDIQAAYLAVLCQKPVSTRADVLEELAKLHRYLESVHGLPAVDFAPLAEFSGARVRSMAPGALSDAEILRVLGELEADAERERNRLDATPQDIRASTLRVLSFILLEASGVRPGSAHGLVLGDLHLFDKENDFLHIHRTGEFGEAKTLTSVGFVRLEGALWGSRREWVMEWLSEETAAAGDSWWKQPLFAEAPGSRRRFARPFLAERVNQLLKWATNDRNARVYWLRKRRVTARLGSALGSPKPSPRIVHRALRECGHVDIRTTLGSYIHDLGVPLRSYLVAANAPERGRVIATTGLPANVMDQAWYRDKRSEGSNYYGVVLDRLQAPIASRLEERVSDPPLLHRQRVVAPKHVDLFARCRSRTLDASDAMTRSGISAVQADALEAAAAQLVVRTGAAPWRIEGIRQSRAVMPPARHLDGTRGLFELLEKAPEPWLDVLVEAWLQQGYVHRLHESSVVLVLNSLTELQSAEQLVARTGARLQITVASGVSTLSCVVGDQASVHASAMRWILAMVWLWRCLATHTSESSISGRAV